MALVVAALSSPAAAQQGADRRDAVPDHGGVVPPPGAGARDVVVTGAPDGRRPFGVVTTVAAADTSPDTAGGLADILKWSPGVTVADGNGPRDIGVSIRGSNARVGSGVRNIVVLDDGFPVTQPNGIARLDLADPHAYEAVVVERGPSSARYGNFALEGAIDFQTRRGRDVDGIAAGLEGGSFGYLNAHVVLGQGKDGSAGDYAAFASVVRGDGASGHGDYVAGTLNARGTVDLSARDRLTGKLIYEAGDAALPVRLSLAQFAANPYQQGCGQAAAAAAGCGTLTIAADGVGGARVRVTAAEAGIATGDRRLLGGLRWEHAASTATDWQLQAVADRRHVDQPSGALISRGALTSIALAADVSHRGALAGRPLSVAVGVSWGYLDNDIGNYQRAARAPGATGAITQLATGSVGTLRVSARADLQLSPALRLALAASAERSTIAADQVAYVYPAGGQPAASVISATRRFWNAAPEAQLSWQPAAAVTLHARLGGGYGIPQIGQLFVTGAGVPGDNTALRAQRNLGIDLGAALDLAPDFTAEAGVFAEWFRDEQVTTSAGPALQSFTTNAPRSRHRGVEVALRWAPAAVPGSYVRATYSFDDQRYTDFAERVSGAAASIVVDRRGARIPGVVPHFATVRLGYDRRTGRLAGLGGFAEVGVRAAYPIDNGGQLSIPGYALASASVEYALPRRPGGRARPSLFVTVRNLTDRTYVGGAVVVADILDPASGGQAGAATLRGIGGSIVAGQPRTIVAGLRAAF